MYAFRCEVPGCNKSYTRKERLNEHLKHIHLGQYDVLFRCPVDGCNKSYTRKERLNIHLKSIHLGQCDFTCPVCNRDFQRKEHMQRHLKRVHGPKPEKPIKVKVS